MRLQPAGRAWAATGEEAGRRVELIFDSAEAVPDIPDVTGLGSKTVHGERVRFFYEGEMKPLLEMLAGLEPRDVVIEHPELEDLFLSLYETGAIGHGGEEPES